MVGSKVPTTITDSLTIAGSGLNTTTREGSELPPVVAGPPVVPSLKALAVNPSSTSGSEGFSHEVKMLTKSKAIPLRDKVFIWGPFFRLKNINGFSKDRSAGGGWRIFSDGIFYFRGIG